MRLQAKLSLRHSPTLGRVGTSPYPAAGYYQLQGSTSCRALELYRADVRVAFTKSANCWLIVGVHSSGAQDWMDAAVDVSTSHTLATSARDMPPLRTTREGTPPGVGQPRADTSCARTTSPRSHVSGNTVEQC